MTGKGQWLAADPPWLHLHGSYEDLVGLAEGWPVTTSTPQPVAEMLRTVRLGFAHTWFVYELGLPAVAWSLLALEAGFRHRLGRSQRDDRADHTAAVINALDKRPVVMGHSTGGLLAQILEGQGLAAVTVAIDPGVFRGVLPLPLSVL